VRTTRVLPPDAGGVAEAARILKTGGLVAFPTETVYGLGGLATDGRAVAGIFAAKGRPSLNPLISHVASVEAARALGVFSGTAARLAEAFWPGPMTLVVERRAGCPVADLATAGLSTLAIRVPEHALASALLAAVGGPVAAPSANRSGRVSPTTAAHVLADLDGLIDAVLDGGPTPMGLESTVLAVDGDSVSLLRPGGLVRARIEAVLGRALFDADAEPERPSSPGMLASHYAPQAPVRLDAEAPRPGEAYLAFGAYGTLENLNLSAAGDLEEAAARLFSALRALDRPGIAGIAVAPIPADGLGEAINDRLRRAAAPRGD
jgi:L-threonylcarbamoyladenylate synthase